MARYMVAVNSVSVTAVGGLKTLIQLITSTKRARLVEAHVSFNGVTASDGPALVEVLRQTTAGSVGSTPTPVKENPADGSSVTTAGIGYTSEPTAGDVLRTWWIDPNKGNFTYPFDGERAPVSATSDRLGLRVKPAADVLVTAYLVYEE